MLSVVSLSRACAGVSTSLSMTRPGAKPSAPDSETQCLSGASEYGSVPGAAVGRCRGQWTQSALEGFLGNLASRCINSIHTHLPNSLNAEREASNDRENRGGKTRSSYSLRDQRLGVDCTRAKTTLRPGPDQTPVVPVASRRETSSQAIMSPDAHMRSPAFCSLGFHECGWAGLDASRCSPKTKRAPSRSPASGSPCRSGRTPSPPAPT